MKLPILALTLAITGSALAKPPPVWQIHAMRFEWETYRPVTPDNVAASTADITVRTKPFHTRIVALLATGKKATFSPKRVRCQILLETGEEILIDAEGRVRRSGKEFQLQPTHFIRLKKLLGLDRKDAWIEFDK